MLSRSRDARKAQAVRLWPKAPHQPKRHKGVRRLGLLYEAAWTKLMKDTLGDRYIAGQWFQYQLGSKLRYAQTDGIWVRPELEQLVIFECKRTHVATSYYQLHELYGPLVAKLYPGWDIRLVTVVQNYDPATPYPGEVYFMHELEDLPPKKLTGVYIWRN